LACFEKILKQGFKIREFVEDDKHLFDQCMTLFMETQKKFHDAIAPLNAWIMIMRDMERESSRHQKGSLNEIKFDKLIKIEVDRVIKRYRIDDINSLFSERDDIPEIEVNTKVNSFSTENRGKIFRGKYEIAFLSQFLTKLKDDLCASSPKYFDKKRKITFSLPPKSKDSSDSSNILSQLSQYADTPPCLRDYLKRFDLYD